MLDRYRIKIVPGATCQFFEIDPQHAHRHGVKVRVRSTAIDRITGREICLIDDDLTNSPFKDIRWTWMGWFEGHRLMVLDSPQKEIAS